jgi:putative CocE/NonD family hydrolase
MRAAWALIVVASFLLAGCVGSSVNEPKSRDAVRVQGQTVVPIKDYIASRVTYALKEIKPFATTAKDGIKLAGHVYIPDAPGPVPVVLEYSPYHNQQQDPSDKREQVVDGRRTMTGNHRILLEAGFAIALVNLRGTGISGGCVQWGTPTDLTDVALVIESLAAQPWSNGRVGMVGTSYPGWTQYMALASKAPSLKAVIPVSGLFDLHSLLSRNGASLSIGPVVTTQWHTLYSIGEMAYPPIDSRGGSVNHNDCGPRVAEDLQQSMMLYAVGDRNAYWDARDIRQEISESTVPILFTNGLTDGEGHILQFEGLWDSIKHPNKRMMIGQWGHGGTAHPSGEWANMRVAWFDHWLRDGPLVVEPGIVEYQDDLRQWHTSDRWPPVATNTTLFMSDKTLVAAQDQVRTSTQTFASASYNPCPGVCTAGLVATPHEPVCTPTNALYISPPLKEDVLLAGNFHVNLTVTSTLPDGNFAVYLYRTKGTGLCPDTGVVEIRRALTDLRHAQAPAHKGIDFPVNSATKVNMISHPFAAQLKAGERLVLAVGGGSTELTPEVRLPVLSVGTGGSTQAQVTLPVVEGSLSFG